MKRLIQFRRPILIVAVLLVIYWVLALSGIFNIPVLKTKDLLLRLKYKMVSPAKNTKDIVIIEINDCSYAGRWAWNRNYFAALTYRLNIYKPAVIGFDLGFFDADTRSEDSDLMFAEALRDSGNVILASYLDKLGFYNIPLEIFRKQVLGYGFTNRPEDIDNIIRDTRIFIRRALGNEILDYSFDLKVAGAFLGASLDNIEFNGKDVICGNLKVPAHEDGCLLLNYTSKLSDFKTVTFADAVEGKISLDFIKDKIVLVGITDPVAHDISLTPFGRMTGVCIIANTVSMFINRNFLYQAPGAINIIVLLVFSLLAGLATSRKQIYKGTIAIFTILAVFIGISIILILNNFIWDFFSIPVMVLAIYIVNSATNYTELLLQSFRMKKVVITDPLTGLATRRYFLLTLEKELKTQKDEDISLVLFGIDNFSEIALEGQDMANSVIKEVADEVTKSSRKTRGIDFNCRYTETEFCTILHKTTPGGALSYAERVCKAKISSAPSLTLSAGIANIGDIEYKSAKVFIKAAEASLRRAREEGMGKIAIYNPEKDYVPVERYKEEKEISEVDLSYVAEEFQEKHKELTILVNKLRIAHDDVIKTERLSAVGKVAATIHHDLSKPIINLRSSLGMIKDDLDKLNLPELAAVKKLITSAVEETERLGKLSDSLKDLYRPKKKEIQQVSINQVLEEMLNLSSAQIVKNKVKLIKNLYPDLTHVMANKGELKQVFLNLIINAIESMPGGGELEITTLTSKEKENTAEIKIRDTGYGISPENMDKLFKAFFTTKKGEKGAGLGLYASMEIVKKFGGKITVESQVDKGTTFKIYLPII